MTVVVIAREFAISGLEALPPSEGYIIQASDFGKAKLVAQVCAISLLMLSMQWDGLRPVAIASMWVVVFSRSSRRSCTSASSGVRVDDKVKRRRRRELILQQARQRRAARNG